jgi:hypothetical protein
LAAQCNRFVAPFFAPRIVLGFEIFGAPSARRIALELSSSSQQMLRRRLDASVSKVTDT